MNDNYALLHLKRTERLAIRIPELLKKELMQEFIKDSVTPERKENPLSFTEFIILKLCKKL